MTMYLEIASALSATERRAERERMTAALAALAAEWGVDAVGREYPRHVTRSDGYRFARPGKWYVVRDGKRVPATAAQARRLNTAGSALSAYGAIGPIAALAALRAAGLQPR